jgi:uncharacterized membrane protein
MNSTQHSRICRIGLIVQALFYIAQGMNHFWHSGIEVRLMPDHYTHPYALVLISGVAEILGGVGLLIQRTRRMASWGLILLLLIYFDVHIFMVLHAERFAFIPLWALYLRVPFQFVFIAWAWVYTRGGKVDSA